MDEQLSVVLVNAWHDDNKGDSAITEGTLSILWDAFVHHGFHPRFTVVGLNEAGRLSRTATRHMSASWPDAVTLPIAIPTELRAGQQVRPLIDVPIWFARLVPFVVASLAGRTPQPLSELIGRADVLIGVGGSNLHDDESVHPLVSMARLYTLIAPFPPAVKAGKPVLLLGHTLGPFPRRRRMSTYIARRMIGVASLAVVREAESLPVADRLGIRNTELAPDMAFALQPDGTERVRAIVRRLPLSPMRTAVIAVRRHPSLGAEADERLLTELSDAVRRLVERDLCGAVVVAAHTIGPTVIEDDRSISMSFASQLRQRLPGIHVEYLQEDLAPAEMAWLYGQMACMIAVRLHAAILAMIMGTPTFAISYFTHKTSGVMAGVGLGDCVGDFATVRGRDIVDALAPRIGSSPHRKALAGVCAQNRDRLKSRCQQWVSEYVVRQSGERSSA